MAEVAAKKRPVGSGVLLRQCSTLGCCSLPVTPGRPGGRRRVSRFAWSASLCGRARVAAERRAQALVARGNYTYLSGHSLLLLGSLPVRSGLRRQRQRRRERRQRQQRQPRRPGLWPWSSELFAQRQGAGAPAKGGGPKPVTQPVSDEGEWVAVVKGRPMRRRSQKSDGPGQVTGRIRWLRLRRR